MPAALSPLPDAPAGEPQNTAGFADCQPTSPGPTPCPVAQTDPDKIGKLADSVETQARSANDLQQPESASAELRSAIPASDPLSIPCCTCNTDLEVAALPTGRCKCNTDLETPLPTPRRECNTNLQVIETAKSQRTEGGSSSFELPSSLEHSSLPPLLSP